MNKTELIAAVAEKAGLTKKDVEKAISATLETVKEEVAKGGKVQALVPLKHALAKLAWVRTRKPKKQ